LPAVESAVKFADEELEIVLLKQLAVDQQDNIVTVQRLMIRLLADSLYWDEEGMDEVPQYEDDYEDEYEDYEDEEEDLDEIEFEMEPIPVFDSIISQGRHEGCYLYLPGPWLNRVKELHQEIRANL
jgi:hypothetical protein